MKAQGPDGTVHQVRPISDAPAAVLLGAAFAGHRAAPRVTRCDKSILGSGWIPASGRDLTCVPCTKNVGPATEVMPPSAGSSNVEDGGSGLTLRGTATGEPLEATGPAPSSAPLEPDPESREASAVVDHRPDSGSTPVPVEAGPDPETTPAVGAMTDLSGPGDRVPASAGAPRGDA